MGFIKEPEGVDFVIQSKPLTKKQEKELSEYIAKRKLEIKKQLIKTRSHRKRNQRDVVIHGKNAHFDQSSPV